MFSFLTKFDAILKNSIPKKSPTFDKFDKGINFGKGGGINFFRDVVVT